MFTTFSFCAFLVTFALAFVLANPALVAGWNRLRPVRRLDALERRLLPPGQWLALALFVLGCALRLWELLRIPTALMPEEAWTAMEAKSLLDGGVSMAGTPWPALLPGWSGEGEGPLLTWLSLLPVALLGPSALAVRLPLVLASCLAMAALYDITRRAASRRMAFWVLLLCAVSPWHLLQSRWSLPWELLPHLLILAIWALLRERRRGLWQIMAFLLLALAMYTGDTAWYVVPLFAVLAAIIQWRARPARWWQALAGLLVFLALSIPAFASWAVQVWDLPGQTVLGMDVPVIEEYAHEEDGIWHVKPAEPDLDRYVPIDEPAELAAGLEFLPFLRGNAFIESLHNSLLENGVRLINLTLLQDIDESIYTKAFLLPKYGALYLFTIPLSLLGALLLLLRPLWQRGAKAARTPLRKQTERLWTALAVAPLPFLLLHRQLSTPHYGVLFYPTLLASAYGLAFLSRRLRLSGTLMVLLYAFALGGFLTDPLDLSHTFPGLDAAIQDAAAQDGPRVVVTTRLYPHESPGRAAEGKTILGFGLSPAYVRGEATPEGELPYAERFLYMYIPALDMESTRDAVHIVHESEAYTLPTEEYDFHYFDEFVVLTPAAAHGEAQP